MEKLQSHFRKKKQNLSLKKTESQFRHKISFSKKSQNVTVEKKNQDLSFKIKQNPTFEKKRNRISLSK